MDEYRIKKEEHPRASDLASSLLSELNEELANPAARDHDSSERRSSRQRGEDRDSKDRDRHRSSSSRHERGERSSGGDRDRERSERSERHRSERGERGDRSERSRSERTGESSSGRDRSDRDRRDRDRGGDRDRSDRERSDRRDRDGRGESSSHRDREKDYDRYDRDRRDRGDRGDRDRERDRHSSRRDDRQRESRGGGGRRGSRSRSPDRRMSPMMDERDVLPLDKRPRKLRNWDMPPPGHEGKTCQEVKALGIFPPPGQPAVLRSEILQGMDPERAAQLVHDLPPRPIRMNYPPIFPLGHRGNDPHGGHGFGNRDGGGGGGYGGQNGQNGQNGQSNSASRQTRRLYCGNIPLGINEESVADFFNRTMMDMNLTAGTGAPVMSVQINHEKNYAFVEFRTPEEATAAMAFDGIVFQSQTLKIRRPKDYQPPVGQAVQEVPQIHVPGVISTNVPDSENKIFIGGLPLYLNDEQVIELLTAFGELRSFNLVKENNIGASKGFAFCEYIDPKMTDVACQGLNNMMLGEKRMVVQRASVGSSRQGNGPHGGDRNGGGPATGANVTLHPNLLLSGHAPTEVVPTAVLQLLNMVSAEELEDDQEYEDILEDIREECSKFGQVVQVRIPRPVPGQLVPGVGKIFVQYTSPDETTNALRALSGRKFADRTVLTSFYDVEKFLAQEF